MRERLLLAACAILLAQCAVRAPAPEAFAFAAVGDTPYNDREEEAFMQAMRAMDAEPLAFVVHVGDFKGGGLCSDELYERRKAQFNGSKHALIYTPGDNEWTDCRRRDRGSADPIERLARLRQVFFADEWSLGRDRIATARQDECIERTAGACTCPAHPENRSWARSRVRFITLNVPGSNNNMGYDRANDAEARCRNEANRRWLERAVRESDDVRALVIFVQANPWESRKPAAYRDFLDQVVAAARRLAKPVLFVHGDTHTYRVDAPFVDATGQPIANLTRLETYGSPFVGWVMVTVDPDRADLFSFEPHGRLR